MNNKSIFIIGNKGHMGSAFTTWLADAGYTVHGADSFFGADDLQKLANVRAILLAVPVSQTQKTLNLIKPALISTHILLDITSVKILPVQWMEEVHTGAVIGTHPLFGPQPLQKDKKTVLVKGKHATASDCTFVEELFTAIGSSWFWATAKKHDQKVALSQSLNFAVSAAFFSTLTQSPEIKPFLTPSFNRHLEAARKHLTQDTEMFLEFTKMNPCFAEAIQSYKDTIAQIVAGNLDTVAHSAATWYEQYTPTPLASCPKNSADE